MRKTLSTFWEALGNRYFLACSIATSVITALVAVPIGRLVIYYDVSVDFLTRPLAGCLLVPVFFYGVLRAGAFHPLFDDEYYLWLSRSPWTPRHPSPKGPIHLIRSDFVALAAASTLSFLLALTFPSPAWYHAIGPITVFSLALTISWSYANYLVGMRFHVYLVFAVPILFGLLPLPSTIFLFMPILTATVAWHGVKRSLVSFPWEGARLVGFCRAKKELLDSYLGWPYRELLGRAEKKFPVPLRRAFVEAVLFGGWCWLLLCLAEEAGPNEDLTSFLVMLGIVSIVGGVVRLVPYSHVSCPFWCLGLRIANRQLFIHRYDQIFFAPILMSVVGGVLPWIVYLGLGLSIPISFATTAGTVVFIGRSMGPSIEELRYTGVHSMFGTMASSKWFTTTGAGS